MHGHQTVDVFRRDTTKFDGSRTFVTGILGYGMFYIKSKLIHSLVPYSAPYSAQVPTLCSFATHYF